MHVTLINFATVTIIITEDKIPPANTALGRAKNPSVVPLEIFVTCNNHIPAPIIIFIICLRVKRY